VTLVPSLQLDGVDAGYNGKDVLHDITLSITEPSIYVVLGPNGAGKTTLLRTIAGILKPTKGKVDFEGLDVYSSKETRGRMSYLSHLNALPEEMTVRQALEFYASIEGGDVDKALGALELGPLQTRKLTSLSQGQKKRVSVSKVLLRERDLYLLDEPTSNLDPAVAKEVRDLLLRLSKSKIVLYSSHNLYEAKEIGTYLILIKDGALRLFDRMENVRAKEYRVGIRATGDLSSLSGVELANGYYVFKVAGQDEVGAIVKRLVEKGVTVTEVKELDNPLEEFFTR
jgi:ABC-2 type transport system ATP-binding protein